MGGVLDSFVLTPITEGDILTTGVPGPPGPNTPLLGPLPAPGTEVGAIAGAPGVVPGGLGIIPGLPGFVEVDALSYGRDTGGALLFSVDEFATGVPGPIPPEVFSEGATGTTEASADAFTYLGPLVATPLGPVVGNTAVVDGDGVAPSGAPGLGLLEPNPPTLMTIPDPGDNLDALDMDTTLADLMGPIFFSLDAAFPDPLELGFPVNSGTAAGNGFSGADVLVSFAGGAPALAIPAATLGLDLAGFDTDDLDALAFDDADGNQTYTAGDTVLFSVRRGSAVIGALDSAFGIPIEEGDILTVPGPIPPLNPAIFIAAEVLGLGTARSGTAGPFGPDDLDALDVPPDQDGDGMPDVLDSCIAIANGPVATVAPGCYVAPIQVDTDGDGYGNPCDGDFDQSNTVGGEDFASPYFLDDFTAGTDSGIGTDMDCGGGVGGEDFSPLFLNQYTSGFPGPSGLSCAGTVPCP
jgi:hypothetical protein